MREENDEGGREGEEREVSRGERGYVVILGTVGEDGAVLLGQNVRVRVRMSGCQGGAVLQGQRSECQGQGRDVSNVRVRVGMSWWSCVAGSGRATMVRTMKDYVDVAGALHPKP